MDFNQPLDSRSFGKLIAIYVFESFPSIGARGFAAAVRWFFFYYGYHFKPFLLDYSSFKQGCSDVWNDRFELQLFPFA